mgnify:FL=1
MKKLLIMIILLASVLLAQNEILINTTQVNSQRNPQIARDAAGNFIVVWESNDANSSANIYYQLFNNQYEKNGSEVLVNNITENIQEKPSVAMNSNGDFVIAWASHSGDMNSIFDIKARIYKNNLPLGDEFLVNTTTELSQTKPRVTINDNGSFIIAWESWTSNNDRDIFFQRFDGNGNKIGNETRANKTLAYSQARPDIKYLSNGNFVITWESWKQIATTARGYDIFASIYDSNGNVLNDEFLVNTYTEDYQWYSSIEAFDEGGFIVSWCSWEQDGFDGGIYLQKLDQFGNKIGDEILVNSTFVNYQWLPKVHKMFNGNIAVVWSSWKQDGDREGVYCQIFDPSMNKISFETIVNEYTESYQWEPDFIVSNDNSLFVVWSSWGQFGKENDYDLIGKIISPVKPQVVINAKSIQHAEGNSTSRVFVHVIDSTKISGDSYEVSFIKPSSDLTYANIRNITKSIDVVTDFSLNGGEGVFYVTPVFDGLAIQFDPIFDFKLDYDNSYFVNNSGSNFKFTISGGAGVKVLAPIDAVVIWGNTDTLADGTFANPSDFAYNSSGQKVVKCPFIVWNITDNQKIDLVVLEQSSTKNSNWEANEEVGLLTPTKYTSQFPRYHASFKTTFSGAKKYPTIGDSLFILTRRPISAEDKFIFTASKNYFTTSVRKNTDILSEYKLYQNYPNPFNPTTTIGFSIPAQSVIARSPFIDATTKQSQHVTLKVYDILGREVATLVNEQKPAGNYEVKFDARGLSSGIYFYKLQAGNFVQMKKMILLR